jgi:hypothetical protein
MERRAPPRRSRFGGRGCLLALAVAVAVGGLWLWRIFAEAAFSRRFHQVCEDTPPGLTVAEFKARFPGSGWTFAERSGEIWASHMPTFNLDAGVVCVGEVREGRVRVRRPGAPAGSAQSP